MSSKDNHKQNCNTNQNKRKLDANKNLNQQPQSKRMKLNSYIQNIFLSNKQLSIEANALKQERDKYKRERDYFYNQMNIYKEQNKKYAKIYTQMMQIGKQNNETINTNNDHEATFTNEQLNNTITNVTNTTTSNNSNNINTNTNTNTNTNNQKTNYYCTECDRYFKNGNALGGHNGKVHTTHANVKKITSSNKHMNGQHSCKLCSKTFDSGKALGGHMRAHAHRQLKSKSESKLNTNRNSNNKKNDDWNDCYFVSVDCKFCGKHFDDFYQYGCHLQNEFNNDASKKWGYCDELKCDSTRKYGKQKFMIHLASTHGYGKPFHCNLNWNDANKTKCKYVAAQKSHLVNHLEKVHTM